MSGSLSREDYETFKKHLEKFPRAADCPVCESRSWELAGIHAGIPVYIYGTQVLQHLSTPMVPMATAICSTCGYARQFVWTVVTGEPKQPASDDNG